MDILHGINVVQLFVMCATLNFISGFPLSGLTQTVNGPTQQTHTSSSMAIALVAATHTVTSSRDVTAVHSADITNRTKHNDSKALLTSASYSTATFDRDTPVSITKQQPHAVKTSRETSTSGQKHNPMRLLGWAMGCSIFTLIMLGLATFFYCRRVWLQSTARVNRQIYLQSKMFEEEEASRRKIHRRSKLPITKDEFLKEFEFRKEKQYLDFEYKIIMSEQKKIQSAVQVTLSICKMNASPNLKGNLMQQRLSRNNDRAYLPNAYALFSNKEDKEKRKMQTFPLNTENNESNNELTETKDVRDLTEIKEQRFSDPIGFFKKTCVKSCHTNKKNSPGCRTCKIFVLKRDILNQVETNKKFIKQRKTAATMLLENESVNLNDRYTGRFGSIHVIGRGITELPKFLFDYNKRWSNGRLAHVCPCRHCPCRTVTTHSCPVK